MILKTNKILPTTLRTNSLCLNAIGVRSDASKKEYIKGHVTDGATSITLKINNVVTSVPVGADGWFEWVKTDNFVLTRLDNMCKNISNIDEVIIAIKNNNITNINSIFSECHELTKIKIKYADTFAKATSGGYITQNTKIRELDLSNESFSSVTSSRGSFNDGFNVLEKVILKNGAFARTADCTHFYGRCYALVSCYLPTINENTVTANMFVSCNSLQELHCCGHVQNSLSLSNSNKLTEQSVVNLFNAVAKDGITLTFHPTVGAMIDAQMDAEEGAIFDAYMNSDYEFEYTY